jgi:hypothetical protein
MRIIHERNRPKMPPSSTGGSLALEQVSLEPARELLVEGALLVERHPVPLLGGGLVGRALHAHPLEQRVEVFGEGTVGAHLLREVLVDLEEEVPGLVQERGEIRVLED